MEKPLVSIIIPTYNRAQTITRSVTSVLSQTITDIEVIVVDDCSIDNTHAVISQIHDGRLRYYCLDKNSGPGAARNYGILKAKGEYIAFQDSDDEFVPYNLEVQLEALNNNDADLCFCQIKQIGYQMTNSVYPQIHQGVVELKQLMERSLVSTQMIFAKRIVFEEILFDPALRMFEDWDAIIRIGQKYKIFFVERPLCKVYLQENSLTHNTNNIISGYKILLRKHDEQWKKYPNANKFILECLGMACISAEEDGSDYFRQALKIKFGMKTLMKFLVSNCFAAPKAKKLFLFCKRIRNIELCLKKSNE